MPNHAEMYERLRALDRGFDQNKRQKVKKVSIFIEEVKVECVMVYQAKSLRMLGISQFFIGVLMILLAIASFAALNHWSSNVACGIWVGLWVGLTGIFAYLGAKSDNSPNNCLIGLMIGFAIIACIFAGVMIIIYTIALGQFSHRLRCDEYYRPNYYYHLDDCYYFGGLSYSSAQTGAAIGSLLLILAVVEFFVALASSIYGCNSCCCTSPSVQTHQQVTYLQRPGGNVIVISPGGVVTQGTTLQTISTCPGQGVPVMYSGQHQVNIPQQRPPVQSFQAFTAYPTNAQVAGGAFNRPQPQQAFQATGSKQVEMPPPYSFSGQ